MRSSGASAAATRSSSKLARPARSSDSARAARRDEWRKVRRHAASRPRAGRLRARRMSPADPARGRGPRSTACSRIATAGRWAPGVGAEPRQRMLEQREQRHRRQPFERGARDQTREHAGGGFRERIAAGVVRRDVPALAASPATRRASARSGVTRAAVRAAVSASRNATAMASASSSTLAASMTVTVVHRPGERAGRVGRGEAVTPAIGRGGRAQRFAEQDLAAMRRRQARASPRRAARCRCAPAARAWRIADGRASGAAGRWPGRGRRRR